MARDSADTRIERIPSIISDILLTNTSRRDDGHSSVHIFDNIVQSISQQNRDDMPPILLTDKDREELRWDRENAMKCEEMVERRKQEQYFDLVDKVQNVLKRIETRNSQKSNNVQSEEIHNPTSTIRSLSDWNNNTSPNHPETYIENIDLFTSPKIVSRTNVSNFGESLNWENSSQPTRRLDNKTGCHSLPANFETTYLAAGNGKNHHGIGRYHAKRPVSAYSYYNGHQNNLGSEPLTNHHIYQRPLSVMSDNHLLYGAGNGYSGPEMIHHQQPGNQTPLSVMSGNHALYGAGNGYPDPQTHHHQQPGNQTSVMSDNQHLYAGINGHYSGQHPETLQRPWNQEHHSPYTSNYNQSHINTLENMDKNGRHAEMAPKITDSSLKTSYSNTFNRSSVIDNSPQSATSQNSILEQRELLALEQKRLEDHYAALQGQLLADFQKRQKDLIEVYNKSLENQSNTDRSMQSILERSFEYDSEETLVSSTTEREHFKINRTEELPQSPFAINVKRKSFHNGENNSRSMQNSAERRKQDSNAFPNSGLLSGKTRNGDRLSQNVPASLLQNSPSDTKFIKSPSVQSYVSPEQSFPKSSHVLEKNTSQRFMSPSFRNSASSDTRKSFNSEVSAQEYHELPDFGENTKIIGNKGERELERNKNGGVKKTSRKNFGVVTSPKRTQLDSFEFQAMKNIKNTQSHKFSVVSACAKGFLTRLLFQTAKIQGLKTTVKDARNVLAEMSTESGQSLTDRSFKERVKAQLHSAQSELRRIFVDSPPYVRIQILEQNRKLLEEKQARDASKLHSAGGTFQNRPKLSNVTMKKRLSRQESREKTPKLEKASTPNSSKVSRGSDKKRNTSKISTKNTPTTSAATPKSEISPVSDTSMTKVTSTSSVNEQTNTTGTSSTIAVTTPSVTTAVTTTGNKKIGGKKQDLKAKNKPAVKSSKANTRVTQTSKNTRRTWDAGVFKPIQGRISPTIPRDKTRLSNEKRHSTLSTARKVGEKLLTEYQTNGVTEQSNTCEVSGIDMSKTYKVNNKSEPPIKKTDARRSLAANLSHK